MGKPNPKQNNLREFSSVKRPENLAKNTYNISEDYNLSKTKPEIGNVSDISIRAKNIGTNNYSLNKEYVIPFNDLTAQTNR